MFTDDDLKNLKQRAEYFDPTEVSSKLRFEILGLIKRLATAEELIESAGDLKRSEAAQDWLRACGK